MITLILFVAGVLILVPLLQRDMRRAEERCRARQLAARFSAISHLSAAVATSFKPMVQAAADMQRSMAKINVVLGADTSRFEEQMRRAAAASRRPRQ